MDLVNLESKLLDIEKRKIELENKISELDKRTQILEERISKKQKPFQTGEGWYFYQKTWDDPNSYLFYVNYDCEVEKMIIAENYEKRWVNQNGQYCAEGGCNYKGYASLGDQISQTLFPDKFWGEYVKIAKRIDTPTKSMLEFCALCLNL